MCLFYLPHDLLLLLVLVSLLLSLPAPSFFVARLSLHASARAHMCLGCVDACHVCTLFVSTCLRAYATSLLFCASLVCRACRLRRPPLVLFLLVFLRLASHTAAPLFCVSVVSACAAVVRRVRCVVVEGQGRREHVRARRCDPPSTYTATSRGNERRWKTRGNREDTRSRPSRHRPSNAEREREREREDLRTLVCRHLRVRTRRCTATKTLGFHRVINVPRVSVSSSLFSWTLSPSPSLSRPLNPTSLPSNFRLFFQPCSLISSLQGYAC